MCKASEENGGEAFQEGEDGGVKSLACWHIHWTIIHQVNTEYKLKKEDSGSGKFPKRKCVMPLMNPHDSSPFPHIRRNH